MRKYRHAWIALLGLAFAFLSADTVYAARDMDFNLGNMFSLIFGSKGLGGILQSDYGVYGVSLILYYLLFYAIFSAGLKRVRIFEGEGGTGLSSPGTLLAHAFSGLCVLAIFAFVDPRRNNVFGIIGIFGVFGQILVLIVVFWLVYRLLVRDRD